MFSECGRQSTLSKYFQFGNGSKPELQSSLKLNSRGVSLVELLIGLSVATIAALALVSIMGGIDRGVSKLNRNANWNEFRNLIEMTLSSRESCTRTLGGTIVADAPPGNNVKELWQRYINPTPTPTPVENKIFIADGSNYPNDTFSYVATLREVRFSVYGVPPVLADASDIPAYFSVTFKIIDPEKEFAKTQVTYSLPISVSTDSNKKIVSCYFSEVGLCKLLGGTIDTGSQRCSKIDLSPEVTSGNPGTIKGNGFASTKPPSANGFGFGNDTGTGLFGPSPGSVSINVNNSVVGWVTGSGGNSAFGIKTNSPQSSLSVGGSVAIGSYASSVTAPANGLIMVGRLGVGNPDPQSQITVEGDSSLNGNVSIGRVTAGTTLDVELIPGKSQKIYMRNETVATDPKQTAVTKGYAHGDLFASKGLCPNGTLLRGFDANGLSVCGPTDAYTPKTCPQGQYLVGYNATGQQVCVPLANMGVCGYRQYLAGVGSNGVGICKTLFELGVCPAGNAMQGVDGSGNLVCTSKMTGGQCPGQVVAGITPVTSHDLDPIFRGGIPT